jgi:dihydroorotase
MQSLTIRRPDDWHVHLRDGEILRLVAPFTAHQFARAIVMPNLVPPITTIPAAADYRERIWEATGRQFKPLMTYYLTDESKPDIVESGYNDDVWIAAKLYPANATTNSAFGVTDIRNLHVTLERMQRIGMVLCVHGEVTDPEVDVFDREAAFIDRVLTGLVRDFPDLKIVLEHITTAEAAEFVRDAGANIAATITPQHLHLNRNALFAGGLRPHAYCLPVAKREKHRLAVRAAAVSGSPQFFLGTDTAPHARHAKESACGCAGIFNAPYALESYTTVFEEEAALDRFEGFASEHGANFYGLPLNEGTVTLERQDNEVPDRLGVGEIELVPFHAGQTLKWTFVG